MGPSQRVPGGYNVVKIGVGDSASHQFLARGVYTKIHAILKNGKMQFPQLNCTATEAERAWCEKGLLLCSQCGKQRCLKRNDIKKVEKRVGELGCSMLSDARCADDNDEIARLVAGLEHDGVAAQNGSGCLDASGV